MPDGPGRPSAYTQDIADEICRRLADGETLREICRSDDMPTDAAVRGWALRDLNGFSSQYANARQVGYHGMADEIIDIADNASNDWMERNDPENPGYIVNGECLQRSRLRVDTRKWMLSKVLPKIYGDKVVHSGDAENPVQIEHSGSAKLTSYIEAIASRVNAERS